jgi:hypothetical protein
VRFHLRNAGYTAGLAALFVSAATGGDEAEDLFQRIKAHMSEHLARLPNYTCHETINRFGRRGSNFQHLDTVDLDVVFTGGRELYSRSGADDFQEAPVEKLVSSGTIGNGALGSHIDQLLSEDRAEFRFAGAGKKGGRKTLRFNLTVPVEKSRFRVRHQGAEGIAGYEGSLWVDAETYDPVRVEFKINRIPSHVGVRLIQESLDYRKLTIGNSEFHLPERSDLAVTDQENNYTLNLTKLDGCHEFTANSTVKFSSPSQGSAARERQDH